MEISIDIDRPEPLFTQLIEKIKQGVVSGKLRPGDPLPSIRQLANDLELNSKTVAKAYRLLERDSVVQSRGYRGTFIHPDARAGSAVDLNAVATEKLDKTIAELKRAGVTNSEIRNAFNSVMNERTN